MGPMVIVGAGECGTRAAFALRENGWAGEIVLLGDEAGLPYERPPLSKPGEGGVLRREICDADAIASQHIDYRSGERVAALDRERHELQLGDGRILGYGKLLLATGASARALNCPGSEHALAFRTHADALSLFGRVRPAGHAVLVGAGLIGMELASTLRQAGMEVTVLEAGERAMSRGVPVPLADRLLERHRSEGVEFRLRAAIERIEADAVLLTDGSRQPADLVLAAIGVTPNTRLAQQAGLALDNGIVVDGRLTTSDPDILAAGDCASFPGLPSGASVRLESWHNARAQGEHAARVMLGDGAAFAATPWFWSDQYDLGLQVAGWPSAGRPWLRRDVDGRTSLYFQLDDDQHLSAAGGLGPGNGVAKDIKLVQMLISKGIRCDAAALQDPAVSLKSLLRG